jgi:hypothetical protein
MEKKEILITENIVLIVPLLVSIIREKYTILNQPIPQFMNAEFVAKLTKVDIDNLGEFVHLAECQNQEEKRNLL